MKREPWEDVVASKNIDDHINVALDAIWSSIQFHIEQKDVKSAKKLLGAEKHISSFLEGGSEYDIEASIKGLKDVIRRLLADDNPDVEELQELITTLQFTCKLVQSIHNRGCGCE